MRRREWLKLLAALGAARARGQATPPLPALPRVNGGINVHPLRRLDGGGAPGIEPELVALQLRAAYELGFAQLRVTLPFARFAPDFFAPIPYVRAARALGIDVVGVMSDFSGYALAQALALQRSAAAVLNTYRDIFVLPPVEPAAPGVARVGGFSLQVLNEPTQSLGIRPDEYVGDFLRPVNNFFKLRSPELTIVSAAEVGNVVGVLRERAMLEAGLETWCDRVAFHVYSTRVPPLLEGLAHKPVWITETAAEGTAGHLAWFRDTIPELRQTIQGVERVFLYDLFDLDPGRYRLIDITRSASGDYAATAESADLVRDLRTRVTTASAGAPTASFEELIPDVTAYFPTQADIDRAAEAAPFLPPT